MYSGRNVLRVHKYYGALQVLRTTWQAYEEQGFEKFEVSSNFGALVKDLFVRASRALRSWTTPFHGLHRSMDYTFSKIQRGFTTVHKTSRLDY